MTSFRPLRPAHRVLIVLGLALGSFALSFADAARLRADSSAASADTRRLVERLGLTDPVLFTEARYTRHPSQADLQSAFQDHPVAFEHFPTGALLPPPAGIRHAYEHLDRKTAAPD